MLTYNIHFNVTPPCAKNIITRYDRKYNLRNRHKLGHTVFRGLDWTGLVKRGLVKRALVKRGLVKWGLVKRGLVKRGLVKRWLVKWGLVKRKVAKRGLGKHNKIFLFIETIISHLKNFSSDLMIKLSWFLTETYTIILRVRPDMSSHPINTLLQTNAAAF